VLQVLGYDDVLPYFKQPKTTSVADLVRCGWIEPRENVIALGLAGTSKNHIPLGLGLDACQKGLTVKFITASSLMHKLMKARDEKRLLKLQKSLTKVSLLIIDELGCVPLYARSLDLPSTVPVRTLVSTIARKKTDGHPSIQVLNRGYSSKRNWLQTSSSQQVRLGYRQGHYH